MQLQGTFPKINNFFIVVQNPFKTNPLQVYNRLNQAIALQCIFNNYNRLIHQNLNPTLKYIIIF